MIPRYSRPEMVAIWDAQTRFRIWFEIEAHACDALADIGVIPKDSAKNIWTKPVMSPLMWRVSTRSSVSPNMMSSPF